MTDYIYVIESYKFAKYVLISSESPEPLEWGGQTIGRYLRLDSELNGYPVYKHEHFNLFLFVSILGDLTVGRNILKNSNYLVQTFHEGNLSIQVWNDFDQKWEPQPTISLEFDDSLKPLKREYPPCKLNLNSTGKLAEMFPDQMGLYELIPGDSCFGRPVWQKGENFLIMDNLGSWVISANHLCKEQLSEKREYFGTYFSYLNTELPSLAKHVWSHIDRNFNIIKDKSLQVTDACDSVEQRQPQKSQGQYKFYFYK